MPVNRFIYGLLGFYLLMKDPLYQLQEGLFGDVPMRMSYVKLSLLLFMMLIVPLYLRGSRLTKHTGWLLLIVVYNFVAVVFLNNRLPLEDRLTIYYIVMFLPLLLLVLDLADIRFGAVRDGLGRRAGRSGPEIMSKFYGESEERLREVLRSRRKRSKHNLHR